MTDVSPIRIQTVDAVRLIHLQQGANALDRPLLDALDGVFAGLESDGSPAVVLTSAHSSVFCPGLDLKRLDGSGRDEIREVMRRFNALLRRLATYPGPLVAAVNGHAIAGGCLLAMACDRRVMTRSGARIGLSEVNLGVPVPAGAIRMLLTLYQTRSVEQLVLEGDGFGGERAFELGLVERLADRPAVVDDALRLASHLGSRPAGAFATAKQFLRAGLGQDMERHDEAELERFLDHWFDPATQDRIGALVAGM